MNIVYASDNSFVDVMCVSIMSFNDHNSDATIYILDCGIQEHNKQKILELCSEKNTVLFVDAKKKLDSLNFDLNLDRGSIAAYARLFVGSMLPNEVKKVLYLDSDTLIRKSLKELYSIILSPYTIGGVRDSFSTSNKRVFGIKKGDLLINSGVLLIDLIKWRKHEIESQIYELLRKDCNIFQGDQGIINMIFHGNVKELPLTYDVMTYLYDFTYEEMMFYRKPDNYFDKKQIESVVIDPGIVHFSSSFRSVRPWNSINDRQHPFENEWREYYIKLKPSAICKAQKKKWVYSRVVLIGVGIMHAYLRPLRYGSRHRLK